ncbi:zinc finger protein 79 [Culex quinquefasciatus]|uniref:Zinc finger protein 79 n=1 Tax=Culex quinquefasciatus TaxID=7176 RepID=B0WHQ9_CULQU|nr:zinc finger protein 79 [Culex quinquefasciatus]|eukprot:XP_001848243.1 zinc finger protein 79 [Culex quinquefasciatus]
MPKPSNKRPPKRGRRKANPPPSAASSDSGSLCRVCTNSFPDQSAMIALGSRTVLGDVCTPAEAIAAIGGWSVEEGEDAGLPQFCCEACFGQLEVAYGVRRMCRESDRTLRKMLAKEAEVNPLDAVEVVCKAEETEEVVMEEEEVKDEPVVDDNEDNNDGFEENVEENSNEESESSEQPQSKRTKLLISEDLYEEVQASAFRCCGCWRSFETQAELYEHGQVEHISKKLSKEKLGSKVQCDICYKTLHRTQQLLLHRSKDKFEYRCKTCGETFINRVRVSTHYRTIHGPNATVCGTTRICCGCAENFPSPEALSTHSEAVHLPNRPPPNPERPFVCDICYSNYLNNQSLQKHKTRFTSKVKKYQCTQCGKQFFYPGKLSDHEKTHLGEKVFQCPECPAAYVSRESLRKHIQRHTMPEDKYKCPECGRCYRSSKNLKEHLNLHTGERPFVCTFGDCSAAFARDTSLAKHILTHTGRKDYQCGLCGKRFGGNSSLRAHVSFTHNKERPFGCFFCERRYPRKDYRRRHMESAHAAELAANPLPAIELAGSTQWLNK